MRGRNESRAQQRLGGHVRRDPAGDAQVHAALDQRLGRPGQHRFDHLDARMRTLVAEPVERLQQDVFGKMTSAAIRISASQPAETEPAAFSSPRRFVEQRARAAIEQLAGRREPGLAALDREGLDAERRFAASAPRTSPTIASCAAPRPLWRSCPGRRRRRARAIARARREVGRGWHGHQSKKSIRTVDIIRFLIDKLNDQMAAHQQQPRRNTMSTILQIKSSLYSTAANRASSPMRTSRATAPPTRRRSIVRDLAATRCRT